MSKWGSEHWVDEGANIQSDKRATSKPDKGANSKPDMGANCEPSEWDKERKVSSVNYIILASCDEDRLRQAGHTGADNTQPLVLESQPYTNHALGFFGSLTTLINTTYAARIHPMQTSIIM